jgi:hypothetical protein
VWSGFNDLASQYPRLASEWSDKNDIPADQQLAGGNKKAWWKCSNGHEWQTKINVRVKLGANCPVCSNQEVVSGINDLSTTYPEIAAQWHPEKNGKVAPSTVSVGSAKSYWWRCSDGHEWRATLDTRSKSGCPRCAKYGFDQGELSELYFIENKELHAWNIGITGSNRKYDRLAEFESKGWVILHRFGPYDGWVVKAAERQLLAWIRTELKLPPFLDAKTLGRQGGSTETLSIVHEFKSLIVERILLEITKAQLNLLPSTSDRPPIGRG